MIKKVLNVLIKIKNMLFSKPLILHRRHDSYDSYIEKQKEKTTDPERVKKWLEDDWEEKLDGFRKLFYRNRDYVEPASNCICLGARTGQEVVALHELKKKAIGIDLVAFAPYTIHGDIHNLDFKNDEFDLVFTNIFDHSLYPDKFISEMERVCATGGFIIINLLLYTKGDDYSENIINDPKEAIKLFASSAVVTSRKITNTFDGMNWEIVMRKN
jgi:SAM-dependent methyltransferase